MNLPDDDFLSLLVPRSSRGIRPLDKAPKPLTFSVYDLEWYPRTYKLRLIGVRDEDGYRAYSSVADFLEDELVGHKSGRTFFAHAGGLSDVQFIFEELLRGDYRARGLKLDAAMSGSAAIRVTIRRDRACWHFADSYWLFRDRLSKIGKSLGLAKGGDFRCSHYPDCHHYCDSFNRDGACDHDPAEGCGMCIFYAPFAVLRDYNERDCEILWLALLRFQEEVNELGGQLRRTIAGTALDLFRRAHLTESIPTNAGLNERIRPGYIASRVEPFRFRCTTAKYYDFNSSFPTSMSRPQPGFYLGRAETWDGEPTSFIRARVSVPDCYVPPLPYRHPKTGAVFFPTGRWSGLFSGSDLELLVELGGRIDKIKTVYRFQPFSDLASYVKEIYGRREKETDEFRRLVYKYLLNSLYGKFGESSDKRKIVFSDDPTAISGYAEGHVEMLTPGVFLVRQSARVEHAHVAISASITSMSRALLTRALVKGSSDSHELYYADTDSVITTAELPTGTGLGALKLEKEVKSGRFVAPKMYMVNGEPKIKGFPHLTREWFDRVVDGAPFEVRRMARLYEILNDGEVMPAPCDREYSKRVRLLARPKRAVDGTNNTRAWKVEELTA